jgi:hypothetical protein
LWQLAVSITKETLVNDEFNLPIISESDKKKDDSIAKDYLKKQPRVETCLKIITELIKDDFSLFF